MNPNDTQLVALRPEVPTSPAPAGAEHFQNTTLRPILKFQHGRILALFNHHLLKKKIELRQMDLPDQKRYVEKAFQHDIALRNQLVGCILGFFTEEEWQYYAGAEKEMSRRLHDLLVQRIQSTLG